MSNPLPLYQIVNWDQFENSKSRTFAKPQFVCVPNKHGGAGLSNVQGEHDGAAIYGVWQWILQMCSRQAVGEYKTASGKKVFTSQRDGWLTDNGKKDGRRLSARELANMFRRPVEEILRCLMVVQSPEVAFIRLVEGTPEHLEVSVSAPLADTTVSAESPHTDTNHPIPDGYQTDTAVSSSAAQKEQKERKEPPIIPQGGMTEIEPSKDTERIPDGDQTDTEEPLQYAEAQTWLNDLFGRKKAWTAKEMHALSETLPIARADQRLIAWAYSLPRDEEGWSLYDGKRLSKTKESLSSLIEDFGSELDKWKQKRQQLGLNGKYDGADTPDPAGDGWTPARITAFCRVFGEDKRMPERFIDLGASACRQLEEAMEAQPQA